MFTILNFTINMMGGSRGGGLYDHLNKHENLHLDNDLGIHTSSENHKAND